MKIIWYLLKCPEGKEADYMEMYRRMAEPEGIEEIAFFQYQRMLRYGGSWHLEKRALLPGCIFLSESKTGNPVEKGRRKDITSEKCSSDSCRKNRENSRVIPCNISCLKDLCFEGNLINMSQGIIRNGIPVVTDGPLKGREYLIRKIDRHRRTAEIELQLAGQTERMAVGLEIYEKQVSLND